MSCKFPSSLEVAQYLRQLLQGIDKSEHVSLDALGIADDLVLRVKNLNALSIGIVADREGTVARVGKLTDPHLSILERLSNKVHGLVLGDGVLLLSDLGRLKGTDLGLVAETVFKFTKGGQKTSTISTDLIALATDSKFNGEPVDGSETLNILITGTEGGETDLLGEISKVGVGKQGDVTEQFVANIGFRSVQGSGVVADILGRVEDTEGKAVQEVAAGQQTHNGAQGEASAVLQKLGDDVELRNLVGTISAVLDKQGEDVLVLAAGVSREHARQLLKDSRPGLNFGLSVLDMGNGLTANLYGNA